MEATLVIIGLNFRTAALPVRERFWMNEAQRVDALQQLARCEGIDEIMILATCTRTEFIFWASDPAEGANSVLRFLTREFDLKLTEWSSFYRLMDDNAVLHLFEVAAGLDSVTLGDQEIVAHLKSAWELAQNTGTVGRILDAVIQKTLSASKRARAEAEIANTSTSLASAAVKLGKIAFDTLENRSALLIGAGAMAEATACNLTKAGVAGITIVNRTLEKAEELARQLGGHAGTFDARVEKLKSADIVINCTSSPELVLTNEQVISALAERPARPLVLIDFGVPHGIDPTVRDLQNATLYDIDNLERALHVEAPAQHSARINAERILHEELNGFRSKLMAEHVVPTIVALRQHLEEICGQELRSLEDQYGPFTEDQQTTLNSLASHITQRIASTMARELKGLPEKADQQLLTEAVQRLFHLQPAKASAPALKN